MIEIACGEAEVQACIWKAYIYNWFATFYGAKGMYCGYGWVQGVNNDVTLENIHWLFLNSMALEKEFKIIMKEESVESITTVQEVVDLIELCLL